MNKQSFPMQASTGADLDACFTQAARTVAPLWPLKSFVAVNPYLGHAHQPVMAAQHRLERLAGARRFMTSVYYDDALKAGLISDADIDAAIAQLNSALSRDDIKHLLCQGMPDDAPAETLPSVCDMAAEVDGTDWPTLVVERISQFAATYFDTGQAAVASARRDVDLWTAWRSHARHDASLDLAGLKGARACLESLPEAAGPAAALMLAELGLPREGYGLYLERLLRSIGGWAAYARQMDWPDELEGATTSPSVEALAKIRLTYDWLVLKCRGVEIDGAWTAARGIYGCLKGHAPAPTSGDVLQEALEAGATRRLLEQFQTADGNRAVQRPALQAAFCIDVRSEIIRRALEAVIPGAETLGFAGFFGFALDFRPLASQTEQAQCPVLLKPTHRVREARDHAKGPRAVERRSKARFRRAFKRFKNSAVGSFAFVDMFGLMYGVRLVSDTLGLTAPAPLAGRFGLKARSDVSPLLDAEAIDGAAFGFTLTERIGMAEKVLRAMSLTQGFARRVLLVGHGSSSRNNPHAAGLDCGACGGHSGEINARVAAKVLNDVQVREGLAGRGLVIPADTIFYGALHDTITDDITLFDESIAGAAEGAALDGLREQLAEVARRTRLERAPLLHIDPADTSARGVAARNLDWAQLRPEWGLAGCSSFIVAPRARTQHQTLDGRAFLHSYNWRDDDDFSVLELIMTAPMVVASWINLQYYASTLDNRVFGAGDKTLHNVVGRLGVLEGAGGDLRVGLPLQSVHDGERYVHTPHRLKVVVEAPIDAINRVIEAHAHVRDLVDNGWVHLFHMDNAGKITHAYEGAYKWEGVSAEAPDRNKEDEAA